MFEQRIDEALQRLDEQAGRFSAVRRDLDETSIDYAVVGGAAVTQYGWERLTKDIDVFMNVDDYERLNSPKFRKSPTDGRNFGKLVHLSTGMDVDVLLGGRGPFPTNVDRSQIDPHLISVEGLIVLKTLRGDPSDYGDIYRIAKSGTKIDWVKVQGAVSERAWKRIEDDVLPLLKQTATS
ncbi:MAG: hypothetical protein Q8K86_10760 [Candidatus Nanopelagicaceae bacterium]|nr:hypothetical protein [Candidatus Nanopelagicaceae bacterium]